MEQAFHDDYKALRRQSRIKKVSDWLLFNLVIVGVLLSIDVISLAPGREGFALTLIGAILYNSVIVFACRKNGGGA